MSFAKCKVSGGEFDCDKQEIRKALEIFIAQDQTFELRGVPSGRSHICVGGRWDEAVEAAYYLSDGKAVYWTLNALRADLDHAASKADVIGRRWFLIDCDFPRESNTNATDEEKREAIELAARIADYLASLGWPDCLMVDSGNGAHLLFRIDLPNDKLSQQLLKGALEALGEKFDDKAEVDTHVHDAPRISKLPGTWARKGPAEPDRPHRMARLVYSPQTLEVVTAEQLQALAAKPERNVHSNGSPFKTTATDGDLKRYVARAIEREVAWLAAASAGERNHSLNRAAFNLGTMAGWPEMNAADTKITLYKVARQIGLEELETNKTIASGWDEGAKRGRQKPAQQGRNKGATRAQQKPFDPNKKLIIWAKDVIPRKVDFLWPDRIPIGKATTLAGQTGMGKTFVACDTAARVTIGGEIPGCNGLCFEQGKVLFISAEDDADDTLVPRLIDLGADLSQIAFLSPDADDRFSLSALELLGHSLDQMEGNIRMVVIDPPTSYLAGVDDHKNAELRSVLAPLRKWTIERRVALVMITHVNKGGGGNLDAMARVMGGAAWVQAVRAAHMFVADPDARGHSLFLPLKVNNAKKPAGLSYQILEQPDGKVIVTWGGEVDTSADDAIKGLPKKSRGVCAVEWLTERFRERREWSSDELKRAAAGFGLSKNALWSPEVNALPIKKRPRMDANGDTAWFWIAQDGWPEPDRGTDGNLGNVDPQVF